MLGLTTTLSTPALGPVVGLAPAAPASAIERGAGEPFAQTLAAIELGTASGGDRQDPAAPGNDLPPTLPGSDKAVAVPVSRALVSKPVIGAGLPTALPGSGKVAAVPVSRDLVAKPMIGGDLPLPLPEGEKVTAVPIARELVAKPVIVGRLPLAPETPLVEAPRADRTVAEAGTDDRVTDVETVDPVAAQPISGYVAIFLAPPVEAAPIIAGANAASVAAPIAGPVPAPIVPLVTEQTLPTATELTPDIADTDVPPSPTKSAAPVSRRLSLKLDPSIEIIDAGRAQPVTVADHPRPVLRFVAVEPDVGVPLPPRPEGVVLAGVAQPALRAFAQAIARAERRIAGTEHRAAPDGADPVADSTVATSAQAIAAAHARAVVIAPRALDTRRDDWPQRLIDRIDAARDAANAADTRIRLVPEALGKIDIALRQEGDTLHVRFTVEQAATRELLAGAQARLADLAEARGLRLGQTGVDGGHAGANGHAGTGGDHGRRATRIEPTRANAPASDSRAETDIGSAERIA
jgi:flagellar hook-length control protein FliK